MSKILSTPLLIRYWYLFDKPFSWTQALNVLDDQIMFSYIKLYIKMTLFNFNRLNRLNLNFEIIVFSQARRKSQLFRMLDNLEMMKLVQTLHRWMNFLPIYLQVLNLLLRIVFIYTFLLFIINWMLCLFQDQKKLKKSFWFPQFKKWGAFSELHLWNHNCKKRMRTATWNKLCMNANDFFF